MAIVKEVTGKKMYDIPEAELEKFVVSEDKLEGALKEIGVRLGTGVTKTEIAGAKVVAPGEGVASGDDVQAYSLYQTLVLCPNCGTCRQIVASTNTYNYYDCGYCGYTYRA